MSRVGVASAAFGNVSLSWRGTRLEARPSPVSLAIALLLGCAGAPASGTSADVVATVSPAASLRQGQEGIVVSVARATGGLSGAVTFELGDLVVLERPGGTDTRLVLGVSVPHGAALGPRALTLTDARGTVTLPAVVEVGAIPTSAPAGLDANRGTTDQPFRTLKQALRVAGAGTDPAP